MHGAQLARAMVTKMNKTQPLPREDSKPAMGQTCVDQDGSMKELSPKAVAGGS